MLYDNIMESAAFIKAAVSQTPEIGIILGSGLGGLVDIMENKEVIPYSQIPHFPVSHVEGHAGNLVFGSIGGNSVVCMQGRFHYYEGFHMQEVTYPVYVMKQLGNPEKKQILMVGDSLTSDMAGGIAAGIDTCWYNPQRAPLPSNLKVTWQIHSLEQLLPSSMER